LSRKGASRPSELKKSTLSSSTASRNSYASDILPHRIDEIITAAIQRRIDCQEVMLYITQLILNASKVKRSRFTILQQKRVSDPRRLQ
jgi:hypothetical protein